MSRIKAQPTEGLSYNATEEKYWDQDGLDGEIERVFDVCHGCRLCFNLCPSFPALFEALDRADGDVRGLTAGERESVVDLCYNCKMCEVRCPYTTRDQHAFQLDFARLMTRAKAVRARRSGVKLRDRLLGNPDLLGSLGSKTPAIANWSCRNRQQRVVMEVLLGIHRDKKLPEFPGETFEQWLARNPLPAEPERPTAKVVLFATCFINYYNPGPGKAAVDVLRRNGCAVTCTRENCCGMPALDGGDVAFAQKQARANVDALLPYVRKGYKIAPINPTCSMTMKREYRDILTGDDVTEFSAAVVDPHELLWGLKQQGAFNREFRSTPGKIAYHVPCHLKSQQIGFRSRDVMRLVPGTEIATVDACTAHDGTWAMKKEYFELSMKWGEKAFNGLRDAEADIMATDCPLSAIQIEQATGVRPLHPIEILARAYADDGFAAKVPSSNAPAEATES
ncbi:MAG TPA: anaerobic glycerol-3-phosphate dehydrogenase subunit C [Candidatus Dormibacteraeota bacterium]|nr:anaerobic glycerol-3-phosphate dehydrogenase subunit C [Candidatus Dormibacteraeota bacterium]